ncbi:hypothetical protein [Breoghania sp.]|uniref:hypothetical protein n=1 Tax=Breoghania sp. TaxID=2065378 RepID=UPI002AA882B7|nr:hypothetical protein [Breoghania sp.]
MISTLDVQRAGPAASFLVLAIAAFFLATGFASAQSPYHMRYKALGDLVLNVEMDPNSQVAGRVRRGTAGIRLHWCEPDIPVAAWSKAADVTARRDLLVGRWCQVEIDNIVGNVRAEMLSPE